MTKDVLISISGLQRIDNTDDDVEMITRGDYYQRNGKHYILYDEMLEGLPGVVKNIIKISPESVDIIKKGAASTHMQFEKNKKNLSCYATPLGELVIGIQTNKIRIMEEEDQLMVNVEYSLDINYQHASECNIILDIQSVQREGIPELFS